MLEEKSFIFFMKKTLVSNLLLTLLFCIAEHLLRHESLSYGDRKSGGANLDQVKRY